MPLHLHRAPRTDQLADALGELVATPLDDPFAEEVVVVPAKGVERWLTQRLSHRLGVGSRGGDGVCAGVRFLSPHSLVSMLLDRDRDDPWDPDHLVWPLLATIDDSLGEPWCATLAAHLGHGLDGDDAELRRNRRYSVARRLAGLFVSYAVQRPSLVADWREGRDTDGAGDRSTPTWAGRPSCGAGCSSASTTTRPTSATRGSWSGSAPAVTGSHSRTGSRCSGTPGCRSPRSRCSRHSASTATSTSGCRSRRPRCGTTLADLGGVVPRDDDHSADLVGHPLLASLGRDTRELRRLLADVPSSATAADVAEPDTLLGWLQHDLRANHAPTVEERAGRRLRDDDRSLQVHACHSAARQVDVLREVLVGLLDDDPTLEPRDILVMCPDIETFAPLISAGFGLADVVEDADGGGHPAHRLRVRLADRALSSTNPLLAVAATLVELAGGRVTASEVLDLATQEACRLRFGFSDDDLARVTRWVAQAGIRWGIDGPSRAPFAMASFDHNTWRSGLDRILLGVAMSGDDHHHLGRGLPVDDVASSDIDLVGRLAEYTARLADCLAAMTAAGTVQEWVDALGDGVRSLTEVPADDAWQLTQFERELARAGVSSASDPGVPLRLADVRALLQSRLGGRPTRANFRTGTLTVCTMVPMRSVPHRVVCLVGLDDGVFPRTTSVDGDDVLARRPLTGERDARSEDRQLLLDALLAAVDTVVITYTGANEHTGAERPPAVPLGEILDATDRTTATAVRDRVLVRHPLQPYDVRNLEPGRLVGERPFSFDRAALAGAVAAAGPRTPPPPLLDGALPPRPQEDVSLADLKTFLTHPVRAFLRRPARREHAVRARRAERRHPGRAGRPGGVAGRRPAAARGAGRPGPGRGDDGRAAARHPPSRRPRTPSAWPG